MGVCLKIEVPVLQKLAFTVAIIDTICTAVLLMLFVLGSSLMVAFEIVGKENNATRVLDIVTDDVFGTVQKSYNTFREKKDIAEDMGVWLIVMFLTFSDFIISCIFLDGVRTRDERKCQTWLNIRLIILVVFKIILLINLLYGTSILTAIPDFLYTLYRIAGLIIGYEYLVHLRSLNPISDPKANIAKQKAVADRTFETTIPSVKVTDESHCGGTNSARSSQSISVNLAPCPSTSSFNSTHDPPTSTNETQFVNPDISPKGTGSSLTV